MKSSVLINTLVLIILSSCGFKVVNYSDLINFEIKEISSSGDERINYLLKNKLSFSSKKNEARSIIIEINTKKKKTVKEKNIKNEITKYKIAVDSNVKFKEISGNSFIEFSVNRNGDFDVDNQYSQTLTNEKKLIDLLANGIADEILTEIINKFNDL